MVGSPNPFAYLVSALLSNEEPLLDLTYWEPYGEHLYTAFVLGFPVNLRGIGQYSGVGLHVYRNGNEVTGGTFEDDQGEEQPGLDWSKFPASGQVHGDEVRVTYVGGNSDMVFVGGVPIPPFSVVGIAPEHAP
jgi:hypothetical protein